MSKLALFSLTALTISAFAEDEIAAAKSSSNNMAAPASTPSMVVLTPASPKSDHGWFVFGDVLYWHASEGNTDWAIKGAKVQNQITEVTNHKLDFKWSWGFKAGLGVNTDYDGWDSMFYYTWFETSNSNRIGVDFTIPGEVSTTPHSIVENDFSSGKYEMSIHYSMFDWELGRAYFVGKKLSLRPHVGLKGGWIHQKVNQNYEYAATPQGEAAKTTTEEDKNDFWGIGVSGGVNTNWSIGHLNRHQFSLCGDFAGALMYGHFDTDFMNTAVQGGILKGGFKGKNFDRNLAVPMLQAMLGVMWDVGFNQDRCHFSCKAGYEFQYWFRQNQMLGITNADTIAFVRLSDDLAFQGITVDFRFDY